MDWMPRAAGLFMRSLDLVRLTDDVAREHGNRRAEKLLEHYCRVSGFSTATMRIFRWLTRICRTWIANTTISMETQEGEYDGGEPAGAGNMPG